MSEYKYCPQCMSEYESYALKCSDCGLDLLTREELKRKQKEAAEMICIYRAGSETEALTLVGLLKKQDINARAVSKQAAAHDGIFQADMGYWGDILVSEDDAEESKLLIQEYLKTLSEEYRVVLVSASNVDEAEKIADCLLNNKQAACVNIFEKVRSRYWWQGKIEKTEEAIMIIKTKRKNIDEIIEIVKKEHSYTVPEIIALPIMEGNEDYLKWISEETK